MKKMTLSRDEMMRLVRMQGGENRVWSASLVPLSVLLFHLCFLSSFFFYFFVVADA